MSGTQAEQRTGGKQSIGQAARGASKYDGRHDFGVFGPPQHTSMQSIALLSQCFFTFSILYI